jgi:hypothetical protein
MVNCENYSIVKSNMKQIVYWPVGEFGWNGQPKPQEITCPARSTGGNIFCGFGLLPTDRQGNGKGRAFALTAVHLDIPAVVLDEPIADRQPQPEARHQGQGVAVWLMTS